MSGTNANALTNPAVSASGEIDSTLIERFTGMVHGQKLKKEQWISYFDVQDVVGTNQVTNKSIGDTQLQTLVAGQEPEAHSVEVDNHSLVVDTIVLARNTIAMLHMIQSDIQVQRRTAKNHVKKLIMLQDETLLTQIMYGAATDEDISNTTGGSGTAISDAANQGGRVSGQYGGSAVKLTANGDETDPVKYLTALQTLILKMKEKEIEEEDMTFACPWEQYYVLMDNEQLTNGDWVPMGSAHNGSKVEGKVLKAYGFPIKPTNRIRQRPHATGEHHQLSNASNRFRYDTQGTVSSVTSNIQNCVGLLFGTQALLVGRTMGLEADMYFNRRLKTNFIDSWFSFGAIADDLMECGAIFAHDDYVPRKKFNEANDANLMVE